MTPWSWLHQLFEEMILGCLAGHPSMGAMWTGIPFGKPFPAAPQCFCLWGICLHQTLDSECVVIHMNHSEPHVMWSIWTTTSHYSNDYQPQGFDTYENHDDHDDRDDHDDHDHDDQLLQQIHRQSSLDGFWMVIISYEFLFENHHEHTTDTYIYLSTIMNHDPWSINSPHSWTIW